ncbi:type I restriction endonuclease [Nostoc sp.]|uniref:type I restriction endonuclease n=1 Tax=Nostoc sp. TaxID=1180 RepID=UPI002FF78B3F
MNQRIFITPKASQDIDLEALIEKSLLTEAAYIKGESGDYDRNYCIDKTQLLQFLRQTQPTQVTKLETSYGKRFEERLFQRISDQIKTRGIVDVFRNGIKAGEVSLTLYYNLPTSQLNPQASQRYKDNIFSVTRQVYFSNDQKRRSLDIVIFINGLPLITFELKNNLTTQNVQDAIKQYKTDRDPKETLFNLVTNS